MESYAAAGNVAEEVISAIRTVYAFGGETKESNRYEKNLVPAMKSGVKRSLITGLGNGILYSCLYFGLALGIWYGVRLILAGNEGYTIGGVIIIFFTVLGAGSNIGTSRCIVHAHLFIVTLYRCCCSTLRSYQYGQRNGCRSFRYH